MLQGAIESLKIFLEVLLNIFQTSKSKKLKDTKLIKEIEQILSDNVSNRKWYVSEVFFEITEIRLSYNDICALVKENNISKILYYIKKYPRVYEYKDGEFKYTQRFNTIFQKINLYVNTLTIWFFGSTSLLLILIIVLRIASSDTLVYQILFLIYLLLTGAMWLQGCKAKEEQKDAEEIMNKINPLIT